MPDVNFIKLPGGLLRPAFDADVEAMQPIRNGVLMRAKIVQPRNPQFLAKFFVLLDLTFGYWEPEIPLTKTGRIPEKNRDKFREDITISAGYYDVVIGISGEARLVAKSISFASMEETEFNALYKAVFSVCWKMVLHKVQGMTQQVADNAINQLLSFD